MITTKVKRPVILTIICSLGFVGAFGSFIYVFNPGLKKYNDFLPAFIGLVVALRFIAYVGIWHMKKWGVEIFALTYFIFLLLGIFLGDVYSINYLGLAFSTWFIINLLFFYKRMDKNL